MTGYLRVIPMLLCMGMIFLLSHQPGDSLHLPLFAGADKLAHVAVYTLLGGTVIFAFPSRLRAEKPGLVFAAALLVPLLYGFSDEYHQRFVAGRNADLLDVAADAAGALLAASIWLIKKLKK